MGNILQEESQTPNGFQNYCLPRHSLDIIQHHLHVTILTSAVPKSVGPGYVGRF